MLPGNTLSSIPSPAPFIGARALPVTGLVDYEDGGIAIQDPSKGLMYQIWRARVLGNDLVLDAPSVEPVAIYSGEDITEVSLAFDQNMRPTVAFVEAGEAKLLWYDSAVPGQVITTLASDVQDPRVSLDDKRQSQLAVSDIILGYLRDGKLYCRQQRDRFQIERLLDEGPHVGLIKIGMNRGLRLQFWMRYV